MRADGSAGPAARASVKPLLPSRESPMAEIRPSLPHDLATITEIYNHYVAHTAATFVPEPCTPEQRRPWFEQFAPSGPHRLLVAEEEGRVVGYAGSFPLRSDPAFLTSVETSIYLAPDLTRRGLGSRLYGALFAAIAGEDLHRAYAGIALPNPASVALHARFGFREVGVFNEYARKFDRYWSSVWMEKRLDD